MLDDETNPVSACQCVPPARRRSRHQADLPVHQFELGAGGEVARLRVQGADRLRRRAPTRSAFRPIPWLFKVAPGVPRLHDGAGAVRAEEGLQARRAAQHDRRVRPERSQFFKELAPKHGIEIVAAETMGVEDTNFNAQLTKIRAANPDMIYNGAREPRRDPQLQAVQAARHQAAAGRHAGGDQQGVLRRHRRRPAADGLMTPIQLGSFGDAAGGETAQALRGAEKADGPHAGRTSDLRLRRRPDHRAAVKNSDGTRQGMRDALEKLKDLPGVNGPVTYSPQDHTGQNFRSIAHRQDWYGTASRCRRTEASRRRRLMELLSSSSSCCCRG